MKSVIKGVFIIALFLCYLTSTFCQQLDGTRASGVYVATSNKEDTVRKLQSFIEPRKLKGLEVSKGSLDQSSEGRALKDAQLYAPPSVSGYKYSFRKLSTSGVYYAPPPVIYKKY